MVQLASELEGTDEGIVVVTRDNQHAPWLNFEAGALSKRAGFLDGERQARVRTLRVDLSNADIEGPLANFQHTDLNDRQDMFKLVQSLNNGDKPVSPDVLSETFNLLWPKLDEPVRQTHNDYPAEGGNGARTTRSEKELLAEVLDRVRAIQASVVPKLERSLGEWLAFLEEPISPAQAQILQATLSRWDIGDRRRISRSKLQPGVWVRHRTLGPVEVVLPARDTESKVAVRSNKGETILVRISDIMYIMALPPRVDDPDTESDDEP